MSGRPRKPRIVKMAQGTFRADRNPENEPEPTIIIDNKEPPSYLGRYAKALWRKLIIELVDTGVLSVVDESTLEMCCSAYQLYRECHNAIYHPKIENNSTRNQDLETYLGDKTVRSTPALQTMLKAYDQYMKYAIQLGLTPVARNRIELKPVRGIEEMDPIERMYREMHPE